jgi:hypothetical protein
VGEREPADASVDGSSHGRQGDQAEGGMRSQTMKSNFFLVTLVALSLAVPVIVWADAEVGDWVGEYNMNHDGHLGTLSIKDSKMDCASGPWCSLVLYYTDGDGNRRNGRIEKIDDRFQHMVF